MDIKQAKDILLNVIAFEVIGTYCIEIQKKVDCSKNCENEDCYLIQAIDVVLSELEKKEAIINEMAKHIYLLGYYDCLYEVCDDDMDRECEDCIKEYFYKKVKETKDNGSTRGI